MLCGVVLGWLVVGWLVGWLVVGWLKWLRWLRRINLDSKQFLYDESSLVCCINRTIEVFFPEELVGLEVGRRNNNKLGYSTKHRVVPSYRRSLFIILSFGVANVVELGH